MASVIERDLTSSMKGRTPILRLGDNVHVKCWDYCGPGVVASLDVPTPEGKMVRVRTNASHTPYAVLVPYSAVRAA